MATTKKIDECLEFVINQNKIKGWLNPISNKWETPNRLMIKSNFSIEINDLEFKNLSETEKKRHLGQDVILDTIYKDAQSYRK